MAEGIRIGVDVGGTFTDLVAWDPAGRMESCKVPTTPANPAEGVLHGIATLAPRTGAWASLAHGTTMVTNAIVERRGAPVGYITTRGFRDVLEIGRMSRLHLYRLDLPAKPEPLVPRRLRREITERVSPDGTVLTRLHLEELPAIVEDFKREAIESVAVCLLHSYASPAHEQALRMALEAHFPYVSISSEINAEFREYERGCTTALNASVMPLAARYLDDLVQRASGKPLHLLHSAGGMMSVEAAKERPLSMAMSGPAGGVAAAAHTSRALGLTRALAFDMGGTTTDVCLIADGVPETAGQRKLGDYPARLPMIAVESIGAGGGSIARVEATGALKVGPRSAGAMPGPACYGQGGAEPTVSDANLLLGCLVSPLRYDTVQTHRARLERWDAKVVDERFSALEAQCLRPLLDEGHAMDRIVLLRSLDFRYVGQNYELEVGFVPGGPGALKAAFEKRHRQLYGYATGENVECVNLRVTARAAEEPPPLPAPPSGTSAAATGSHRAYFPETGAVEMLRYDRASLPPGHLVEGPAMVEDDWSTTIVYPSMRCVADRLGNLVIEAGAPA